MRRHLIFSLLACGLLAFISPPTVAQTNEPLAEASRLNDKCLELYEAGKYNEALEPCQRSLSIYEKELGGEHRAVATTLNNLAQVYQARGEYVKAGPLFERALAIREKVLGSEHSSVATSLNNLAELYRAKGDYAKAEPLYQRAVAVYEKTLGAEHPYLASSLNNLAQLYGEKGDFMKAEPLYQRALAILEKALGSEHPGLAPALNNLAELYRVKGDYRTAEGLHQRALAIREKALGSDHPNNATSFNNLAMLAFLEGDYEKAESRYGRALAIYKKGLDAEHPLVANTLNNLALVYQAKKDYPRAIEFWMRGQEIRENHLNAIFATGSEKQKQLYLDKLVGETAASVSLHAHSVPTNPEAARLALTTILRRKGRALDVMADQIAGLRRRAAPDDVKLLDALARAQSQFANLQLSNARMSPDERRMRVTELETEIEKLEGDIGRRSVEFRTRTQPVTLDAVRGAIPADSALVEIFVYRPFNAKANSIPQRFGNARYVAYVLKPTTEVPQFVDLGEAATVDAELKLWRTALLDPGREDARALGRKVDERVMRPVRKLLGGTKRLSISPDGALNLIPFAALVDEKNKYLVETYSLNYLTSGRDLLRLQVQSQNRAGAFIFANPTYNLTNQAVAACENQESGRGLVLVPKDAAKQDAAAKRDIEYRGIDFTQLCYSPLKGTAEEATLVNAVFTKATVLTEQRATEAAVKALNAPQVLHVATHGFFLPDQPQAASDARQIGLGEGATNAKSGAPNENPLLRSGLIMAGANQGTSGPGEDGVLTAAEVAGLNLWGTKLVVLSACETGLGDVVNGAGVYGLRRALVLAGSETQVMSLWQVDDDATRDLMGDYYERLQRGEGRTEAMRQSQLAMLRRKPKVPGNSAYSHPFYWAAFISSGDWRSMSEKESDFACLCHSASVPQPRCNPSKNVWVRRLVGFSLLNSKGSPE
jgi:CHAT domain-containing protein/tetratricopeptide (TPR) repeat protein